MISLAPVKILFEEEGLEKSEIFYLDFLNEEIYDLQFNLINSTKIGNLVVSNMKKQKSSYSNSFDVQHVVQKALKAKEKINNNYGQN